MRLVPSAPIRGWVLGNSSKRALTGFVPTILFQASGFLLRRLLPDSSRRLPCANCSAIVVMLSHVLSKGSERGETAVHLRRWLAGLALPRAVQMYWDWLGARIGLLYYCSLSATSALLFLECRCGCGWEIGFVRAG